MNDTESLKGKLLGETAKLAWSELERHFARGVLINIAGDLDLIDVAMAIANDNTHQVQAWLDADQLSRPDMDDAKRWHDNQAVFWSVVVAPWVLIQDVNLRTL